MVSGIAARLRRLPSEVVFPLVIGVLLLLGFVGIIVPQLRGATDIHAEVAGAIPDTSRVGETVAVDLAVDNTGSAPVQPLCLLGDFSRPVAVTSVTFQGLDRVAFVDGRACGGQLSGQETINVRVTLVPREVGQLRVGFTAGHATAAIGPSLTGTIEVRP